jgi:hypothetical protein
VIDKGVDNTNQGRWFWTQYRGKDNVTLKIYSGYCPNYPNGPLSVYAQQRYHMLKSKDERCPRLAFAQDLSKEIDRAIASGDRVIVMLDANIDIRHSIIQEHLQKAHLKETLINKNGTMNKSTFQRNQKDIPIDGIWISEGLQILHGGTFCLTR